MGEKPLYYYRTSDLFAFSSDIRSFTVLNRNLSIASGKRFRITLVLLSAPADRTAVKKTAAIISNIASYAKAFYQ